MIRTLDLPAPQDFANFGACLAMADVDGDKQNDVIVGASLEDVGAVSFQGRAYVFSADDGSLIWTLDHPEPQTESYFGTVAAADGDGDGLADVLVAAYELDVGSETDQGRAYLFSGATGLHYRIFDLPDAQSGAAFGRDIDMIANTVAIGAPLEDVGAVVKVARIRSTPGPRSAALRSFHRRPPLPRVERLRSRSSSSRQPVRAE